MSVPPIKGTQHQDLPPSFLESVGKGLGYIWKKVSSVPYKIYILISRIKGVSDEKLKTESQQPLPPAKVEGSSLQKNPKPQTSSKDNPKAQVPTKAKVEKAKVESDDLDLGISSLFENEFLNPNKSKTVKNPDKPKIDKKQGPTLSNVTQKDKGGPSDISQLDVLNNLGATGVPAKAMPGQTSKHQQKPVVPATQPKSAQALKVQQNQQEMLDMAKNFVATAKQMLQVKEKPATLSEYSQLVKKLIPEIEVLSSSISSFPKNSQAYNLIQKTLEEVSQRIVAPAEEAIRNIKKPVTIADHLKAVEKLDDYLEVLKVPIARLQKGSTSHGIVQKTITHLEAKMHTWEAALCTDVSTVYEPNEDIPGIGDCMFESMAAARAKKYNQSTYRKLVKKHLTEIEQKFRQSEKELLEFEKKVTEEKKLLKDAKQIQEYENKIKEERKRLEDAKKINEEPYKTNIMAIQDFINNEKHQASFLRQFTNYEKAQGGRKAWEARLEKELKRKPSLIDLYCDCLTNPKNHMWGGHIELSALSEIMTSPIVVFTSFDYSDDWTLNGVYGRQFLDNPKYPPLLLYYVGGNHYQNLIPK